MYSEWLNRLIGQLYPPQTISIGYGEPELDLPVDYARALCDLFAGLGLRGVTVLAASGNDGVGAGDCISANGNYQFMPEFPSSCKLRVAFYDPFRTPDVPVQDAHQTAMICRSLCH